MPDLLRFSKLAIEAQGCDGTYLKKLSDYIVPAFVEALHKVMVVLYINIYVCFFHLVKICAIRIGHNSLKLYIYAAGARYKTYCKHVGCFE